MANCRLTTSELQWLAGQVEFRICSEGCDSNLDANFGGKTFKTNCTKATLEGRIV